MQEKLPPTDSRLRPDQRYLENGEFEMANSEKLRLEQRQRQVTNRMHFFISSIPHSYFFRVVQFDTKPTTKLSFLRGGGGGARRGGEE